MIIKQGEDFMRKSIVFIGNYTDDATYKLITENNIRDLSQAARMFQRRLINNLAEQDIQFNALSLIPTDGKVKLPKIITDTKTNISVVPIKNGGIFSNLKAMQQVYRFISGLSSREIIVLMYAVNPIAIIPLLRQKKKYNLTLTTICPELPQYRRYRKSLRNVIKKSVFNYYNKRFDKYIVFAEAMKEYLPKGRPCMLLEGFAPDQIQDSFIREKNIALYAGGLAEDNGIKMMIDAAHKSRLIDEFWICGVGDCLEYVKANTDERVRYLGRLTNEEVLCCEKEAKVLLNVRNPKNQLTKFSFPSKILEYMAAGGVVVSSELPGIPSEYFEHIVPLREYTSEELASVMDYIFSMDDADYLRKTKDTLCFVQKKNAGQRCREILEFI